MGRKHPWCKHNFREVPGPIWAETAKLPGDEIIVACVLKVPAANVQRYRHLGLDSQNGMVSGIGIVAPDRSAGMYSRRNAEGQEIVRKDLPMVTKAFSMRVPNWGDWSHGSHEIVRYRDVYQREFIPPRDWEIATRVLQVEVGEEPVFVIKFAVAKVLNRTARHFGDDLLFAINLLQEQVGAAGVFAADAKDDDYLSTVYMGWEILPPGQRDITLAQIVSRYKQLSGASKEKLLQRYNLLSRLKPTKFIVGTNGFRRYFGALFGDNLVVFENLDYGNAIYVMYEGWQELSQRSRTELLSGNRQGYDRILHRGDWESALAALIELKRKGRAA